GGQGYLITDPVTGESLGDIERGAVDKVKVNNGLRRVIRTAIGQMTLLSDDRATRLSAAQSILKNGDPAMLELLDEALAAETDPAVEGTRAAARAVSVLKTDATIDDKRTAVDALVARGGRDTLTMLSSALASAPAELQPTIEAGIDSIG